MDVAVIIVEPKYAGNVGAIARLMKNFGFSQLWLISPKFSLDDEDCIKYAMHAYDIIEKAEIFDSFDEVVEKVDFMAGTSSIESRDDRRHLRKTMDVREFGNEVRKMKGKIGIAFGREDYGLLNEEIKKCDVLIKIPTKDEYAAMNLSHAVAIVLYEVAYSKPKPYRELADGKEKEKLHEFIAILLDSIDYPEYKKEKAKILIRRIIGRAMISKWEFHTLMGIIRKTIEKCKSDGFK